MVSQPLARAQRSFQALVSRFSSDSLTRLLLVIPAFLIACYDVNGSGPLWPDAPQYANAGAMMRDWLFSGELSQPYEFALSNYVQYPAFHLPYHPPAYPALLGLFFSIGGVSYLSARLFIALCLWVAACFFHAIVREKGIAPLNSLAGALIFLSLPEIAFWSRDTMSEVPALSVIVAGSYFFLLWLRTGRRLHYGFAFALAEIAFLSRYLAAGVILAWLLWAILAGRVRNLFSLFNLILPILFLGINAAWVLFALRFSKFETVYGSTPPNTNYLPAFSWELISFYSSHVPAMVGWLTLVAVLIGIVCFVREQKYNAILFWLAWIAGYWVFVMVVGIYNERRYFIYAMPAVAGLAICVLECARSNVPWRYVSRVFIVLCILSNVLHITRFPSGVVGYENVGRRLAGLEKPGNILLSSFLDSDLIFRYRSSDPALRRILVRADRSLTIRPPVYTDVPAEVVADTGDEALQIIQRGRIRYLVSCATVDPKADERTPEMILLHETLQSRPESFTLLAEFPLLIEYGIPGYTGKVFLWEFLGELPEGPSEIPIHIPTADMQLKPTF